MTTEITPTQELFLCALEEYPTTKAAAEAVGMTPDKGYHMVASLKDVILERARSKLAGSMLRAVQTTTDMLDADAETQKGELRLKSAESIMDRTGLTKHTNVDVEIETTNGIFILPAKTVPDEDPCDAVED